MTYSDFTKWVEQRLVLKHSDIKNILILTENAKEAYNISSLQILGDNLFILTGDEFKPTQMSNTEKEELKPIEVEMPPEEIIKDLEKQAKYYRELAHSFEKTIITLVDAIKTMNDGNI